MVDPAKTVFISYRRSTSQHLARAIYEQLRALGYDVFLDIETIDSVDFARSILGEIAARTHFLVILSPGTLDRTTEPRDWLRREIEFALEQQRNIVPLLVDGFTLQSVEKYLTGRLAELKNIQAITINSGTFNASLRTLDAYLLGTIEKNNELPPTPLTIPVLDSPSGIEVIDEEPISSVDFDDQNQGRIEVNQQPSESKPATLQFTAFYPEIVQQEHSYALMVFAHLDTVLDTVRKIAENSPLIAGKQTSSTDTSRVQVEIEDRITFVLRIPDAQLEASQQTIQWRPPYQQATFFFTVKPSPRDHLIGIIQVYAEPLLIGEIPVKIRLSASEPKVKHSSESHFHRFDPIFASYSHADTPIMEYFRQTRENLGEKMLVDIYDLRVGDHWEDRILQMIDESVVFQLFWSKHSANSEYCRKEWQHALKHDAIRPRFIQPVYWEGESNKPTPTPPLELSPIQFQKVSIPPITRVGTFLNRLAYSRRHK